VSTEAPGPAALAKPQSLGELFWAFTRLAMQGFGGVLAISQRELVERLRWMSKEDFVETLAIAQVLPGPNVVNLSMMVGDRYFGFRGAFVALAGMLLLPAIVVLVLAALYGQVSHHPVVVNALRGMGTVAAGLVLATGIKLLPALRKNPLGRPVALTLAAATFGLIALLRLPLPLVILGLGTVGMALAWRALKP